MKKASAVAVVRRHPMLAALFLFATLLTLVLLLPKAGTSGEHGSGCPYLSQGSSGGCPYAAHMKGSGCPHMAASKGSGCPYMAKSRGCLHALKHSLELDEEQKGKVQEIQSKFLDESAELKKGIQEATADLDRLFRDPDASMEDLSDKRKDLAGLKERLDSMAMDFRLKIRGELTDEQIRQIPEGCWHGILAHGHGKSWGCPHGCKCPHKGAHSDVSA